MGNGPVKPLIGQLKELINETVSRLEEAASDKRQMLLNLDAANAEIARLGNMITQCWETISRKDNLIQQQAQSLVKTDQVELDLKMQLDAIRQDLADAQKQAGKEFASATQALDIRQTYTCHMEELRMNYIRRRIEDFRVVYQNTFHSSPAPKMVRELRKQIEEELAQAART